MKEQSHVMHRARRGFISSFISSHAAQRVYLISSCMGKTVSSKHRYGPLPMCRDSTCLKGRTNS